MNERIEKLAELCGFRPSPSIYDRNQSFDIEKFAALVAAAERESVAASSKRDLTCVCGAVWEGEQMVHAPRKREWVGLTVNEAREFYESNLSREELIHKIDEFLEEKNT
jgi:hypothetical protein